MPIPQRKPAGAATRPQIPRMNRDRVAKNAKDGAKENRGSGTYSLDMEYFKPTKGSTVLRIFPYLVTDKHHPDKVPPGELWWKRPMKVHFGVGPEEKARICPTTTGKPCPICTYAAERKRSGEASEDELKQLKPKDRDLYIVADVKEPDKLMSFETSFYTFTQQLCKDIDDDPEGVDGPRAMFADLEQGMDIRVRFGEKSMGAGKPFTNAERFDFITRKVPVDLGIWNELPALDDCLNILDYNVLEAEFLGMPIEEKEDLSPAQGELEDDVPFEEEQPEEVVAEEPPPPVRKPAPAPAPKPATPAFQRKPAPPAPAAKPAPTPAHKAPAPVGGTCPVGGKFGEDTNQLEACDTCDVWEDCQAAFEKMVADKRAARK